MGLLKDLAWAALIIGPLSIWMGINLQLLSILTGEARENFEKQKKKDVKC